MMRFKARHVEDHRAKEIADNFNYRCQVSHKQGKRFCDTQIIVEDGSEAITPIETTFLFNSAEEAAKTSEHLVAALEENHFTKLNVSVEPLIGDEAQKHIKIRAEW